MGIVYLAQKRLLGFYIKQKYKKNIRDKNVWVFGEWFGERCIDNCCYLANYVAEQYPQIELYWVAEEGTDLSRLDKNISVLKKDSEDARNVLLRCGAAIVSQSLEDLCENGYNYASGALTVQLWHGVPWKKIGHDGNHKNQFFRSIYIKYMDYICGTEVYISPSEKYDQIVYTAFGGKEDQILHAGYARNMDFYNKDKVAEIRNKIINRLRKLTSDINLDDCRIITYMPTFRNRAEGSVSIEPLIKNQKFLDYINQKNIVIIQKAHFVNQVRDNKNENCAAYRIINLNDVAAQELLCATDLLITDYSGCFFDFLILDRPIVHYLYDYDYYRTKDRGLYYTKEEVMAGTEANDEQQLADAIVANLENPQLEEKRRRYVRNIFMEYDTENTCKIICEGLITRLESRKNIK